MTQEENKKALDALLEKLPSHTIEPFDDLTPGGMINVDSIKLAEFEQIFATIRESGYTDIHLYPWYDSFGDVLISIQFTTASGWFKD